MNSALLIFALVGAYPLGPNFAAGPSHWNADVHAPQAFYPTELNLIADRGDCNLPDTKPTIYVDYFYADWCADCAKSTQLADNLKAQGYSVIKANAADKNGATRAQIFNVKSVPFWIVSEGGETILRTNDPQKVLSCLSDKKPGPWKSQRTYPVSMGTVYAPDGSCTQCGYGQPVYYQQQQVSFWQRGRVRRWVSNRGGWIRNGNHPVLRFLFRGRRR